MHVVVPIKQVPDLVEELELADAGTDIDREFVKFVLSEWDDQAIEEAICLKEASGATVTVVALDDPDVDNALFAALAKGADRAVKLTGAPEGWVSSHERASAFAAFVRGAQADLVLSGVQAVDDLDGQMPPLLAAELHLPYVSVVVSVDAKDQTARVVQELGGGRSSEFEVTLPAVLGVQAARQAPRYVPISKIRQVRQEGGIEALPAEIAGSSGLTVKRLYEPDKTGHAEMLSGSAADVAAKIAELLRARGLIT